MGIANNWKLRRRPLFILASAAVMSCVSKTENIKAIANGVRGGIAGSKGHFAAMSKEICTEMPQAETTITPPLDRACSRGCVCASTAAKDVDPRTTYDCSLWEQRPWQLLKFSGTYDESGKVNELVHVHHKASWHRTERGCDLTFTVYGDLDEDGTYSTYIVTAETTPDGTKGHWPDVSVLWE